MSQYLSCFNNVPLHGATFTCQLVSSLKGKLVAYYLLILSGSTNTSFINIGSAYAENIWRYCTLEPLFLLMTLVQNFMLINNHIKIWV